MRSQIDQGNGILHAKRTDRRAGQSGHDGRRPQGLGQVAPQGPDIGTAAAGDVQHQLGVVVLDQLQLENGHFPRRQGDVLALASQAIGAAAGDLHRRIGAGSLLDRPGQRGQGRSHLGRRRLGRTLQGRDLRFRIIAGTGTAQEERGPITFAHALNVIDQPRGLAHTHNQHAARQRIQRAGMPRFDRARGLLHPIDHIPRGHSGRFVDVQQAKHDRHSRP